MQRFQKLSKKVLDRTSDYKSKVVAGATLGYVTVANAAPVALPATAQADIEGSVINGGDLMIGITVLVLGYIIITRLVKRT